MDSEWQLAVAKVETHFKPQGFPSDLSGLEDL
jgi:hypothetical protein